MPSLQHSAGYYPSLTASPFLCCCDLNSLWATWTTCSNMPFSTIMDWNPLKPWAKRNRCCLKLFLSGTVVTETDTRRTSTPHATIAHLQRKRKYYPTLVCHRAENETENLVMVRELLETEPGKALPANSHYNRNTETTLTRHQFSLDQAATLPPLKS